MTKKEIEEAIKELKEMASQLIEKDRELLIELSKY